LETSGLVLLEHRLASKNCISLFMDVIQSGTQTPDFTQTVSFGLGSMLPNFRTKRIFISKFINSWK